MNDKLSIAAASGLLRDAMRETVKRHSLWYLLQAGLMVVAGILALVYPLLSAVAVAVFLGWILILSGVVQGLGLIGAARVPHFWLQLVSVVLSVIIGLLFVLNPTVAVEVLILLLIVFFMVEGISKVIFSLTVRPLPNWYWVCASGLLGIVLSIVLLLNPSMDLWVLGLFVGLQLIGIGVSLGAMAWTVRKQRSAGGR